MSDYKKDLLDDLKNRPGYAAKYLTAAAADSTEAFLVALLDVWQRSKEIASLTSHRRSQSSEFVSNAV